MHCVGCHRRVSALFVAFLITLFINYLSAKALTVFVRGEGPGVDVEVGVYLDGRDA